MNKKVMLVDDDLEFLEELREMLVLSGYALVVVDDANRACQVAEKERPSVVLLDLKMPGKNGFEVAQELRHCDALQNIPIIAMTAYFKEEYPLVFESYGIRFCLKKPFNPLDVIAQIEDALAQSEAPIG